MEDSVINIFEIIVLSTDFNIIGNVELNGDSRKGGRTQEQAQENPEGREGVSLKKFLEIIVSLMDIDLNIIGDDKFIGHIKKGDWTRLSQKRCSNFKIRIKSNMYYYQLRNK